MPDFGQQIRHRQKARTAPPGICASDFGVGYFGGHFLMAVAAGFGYVYVNHFTSSKAKKPHKQTWDEQANGGVRSSALVRPYLILSFGIALFASSTKVNN